MRQLLLLLSFCLSLSAFSENTDPAVLENALKETQKMMKDAQGRKEMIGNNREAIRADQNLKNVAGNPKTTEDIYSLAADIFGTVGKSNAGDPDKMEKALEKAMTDPEGFANSLPPDQRARLREIAGKIEKTPQTP